MRKQARLLRPPSPLGARLIRPPSRGEERMPPAGLDQRERKKRVISLLYPTQFSLVGS